MRRERAHIYRDQFEYLADCFDIIRKRGDAFNIRNEAQETERMVRYSERTGFESERSHLLEIYRDIEREIEAREDDVRRNKARAEAAGIRFPIDGFMERHALSPEEVQILFVLLYNESVGRTHARFQSGNEILNLLFPNPVSALKAAEHLGTQSHLFQKGLVQAVFDDHSTNFLRASYEVTEKTLHEVLGVRDRESVRQHHGAKEFQTGAQNPGAERIYRTIVPRVSLDQVVLSGEMRTRLEEVLWQVERGDLLFKTWGLEQVMEKGRGTILLFCGPPGTGKTMTAEALAERLSRPLFAADYSQLESKWIGDTEKNIVGVFRDARTDDAVLLLDEADSILAARLDGGHYNDRAYNRQVSLLLTELENFDGVCILTTNREVTLDTGLARRISARFDFTIPGVEARTKIWNALVPAAIPLGDDVDFAALAERFPMAGGNIKNVVLGAVRRAARRDGETARVGQDDFECAAAHERESFEAERRAIGFRSAAPSSYSFS
jgi:AAA+ superfamily predicted ATPase